MGFLPATMTSDEASETKKKSVQPSADDIREFANVFRASHYSAALLDEADDGW